MHPVEWREENIPNTGAAQEDENDSDLGELSDSELVEQLLILLEELFTRLESQRSLRDLTSSLPSHIGR